MADTVAAPEVASPVSAKKGKASAAAASKKPRVKPSHPPTSEMVYNAIKSLKERGGSSLQAIKKYLASNYKTDADKLAPFIKKYLKSAVANGQLIQTKGKGASGSFKLAAAAKGKAEPSAKKAPAKKPAKAKVAKKPAAAGTKKKSPAKKPAAEKKKAVASVKAAKKTSSAKPKSPTKQKPTKATKSAAKKPKTPKPKKAAAKKPATAAKKAAPKKK